MLLSTFLKFLKRNSNELPYDLDELKLEINNNSILIDKVNEETMFVLSVITYIFTLFNKNKKVLDEN